MCKLLTALVACVVCLAAHGQQTIVESSGVNRPTVRLFIESGGANLDIKRTYIESAGVQRLVFSAFSVSVDDSTGTGACVTPSAGSCTAFVPSITCTGNNPVGSVTYAWTYVSGTNATIASPSSASTTFSRSAPASGGAGSVYVGTFRCTATDAGSGLSDSVDITLTTTHVVGF